MFQGLPLESYTQPLDVGTATNSIAGDVRARQARTAEYERRMGFIDPLRSRRQARLLFAAAVAVVYISAWAAVASGYLPKGTVQDVTSAQTSIHSHRPLIRLRANYTLYTFIEQPVFPDMVAKQLAVTTAERFTDATPGGKVPAHVTVTAHFGIYADESFLPRPVWLVHFSGSGVNICVCDGGDIVGGRVVRRTLGPVVHHDTVVIDGRTGKFLVQETGSDLP